MPLSVAPVTIASNVSPIRDDKQPRGGDLAHRALDLARGVLALGAVRGDRRRARRRCTAAARRRAAALSRRCVIEIGIAAVRRGRVRVVVDREPEVAVSGSVARWSTYSPGPSSFTIDERQVGEARRIGGAARASGTRRARCASGSAGSVVPSVVASSTMRSQRFGARTTRRIDDRPRCSRKRAVAPFAAIIRSSMSSRARFLLLRPRGRRPGRRSVTARASIVSSSSAPCSWRSARSRCAASSCSLQLLGDRAAAVRRVAGALEPRADALVDELRVVGDARDVDRRSARRRA